MSNIDRTFIQQEVDLILAWREHFQWLVDMDVVAGQIATFGCGTGESVLGLMWAVEAFEGLGLDKDPAVLEVAHDRYVQLQWELEKIWTRLRVSDTLPQSDFIWWNDIVPDFIKRRMQESNFLVEFTEGEPGSKARLPFEYYDLAYVDFLLHKIWWDRNRTDPENDTRLAIGQMMRVVRPGGFIVAYEWEQFQFNPSLDYRRLFEQLGLRVISTRGTRVDNWRGKGNALAILGQKRA